MSQKTFTVRARDAHDSVTGRRKDARIETLRGLAILLVVAGHVIGADADSGLRVDDRSTFRYLVYSAQFLRMPLFTVISGFVYSLRPVDTGSLAPFLRGKMRRILVPFVVVSTLEFLTRLVVTGVNRPTEISEIWKIYLYPFDHFWFLQSIFLIFLTVAILDSFKLLSSVQGWTVCFLAGLVISLGFPRFTNVFGFNGYLFLLPYFLLGCGLCRYPTPFRSPGVTTVSAIVLTVAFLMQQIAWFMRWDFNLDRVGALAIAVGLPATILLVTYRFRNERLAKLGFYSYSIYLFHVFGTAGCRIFLERFGVDTTLLVFPAAVAAGLAFPIVLEEYVLLPLPLARFLGLGLRMTPQPGRREQS